MIHYQDDSVTLYHGDCLDVLKTLPDDSVDAVVTDPPYELNFMSKGWDREGIAFKTDVWQECLRVLKPGGHLLAFGGTRTWHRLACAIEDAGFEVRDSIAWLYGSGFPKSLDVSKAIDKAAGAERTEVVGTKLGRPGMSKDGSNQRNGFDSAFGGESCGVMPTDITAPATDAAKQWQGWGTALKPAHEPIVVARKPLQGTVAANVLAHGVGALNIDACRIAATDKAKFPTGHSKATGAAYAQDEYSKSWTCGTDSSPSGRWPANVVLDDDSSAELDRQNGGASRFFYCAKAPTKERPKVDGVSHPTVKPLDLMRWLIKLVTPPDGVVLDPFAGSGTTGEAAVLENKRAILIEREDTYLPLIVSRLSKPAEVGLDFA